MLNRQRALSAVVWVIFVIGVVITAARTIQQPTYNWDLLAYSGCVRMLETKDPVAIQAFAFGEARRALPEKEVSRLVGSGVDGRHGTFRARCANEPETFLRQLAFFDARVGYIWPIALLNRFGIDTVRSQVWMSSLGFVIVALLLLRWLGRLVPTIFAAVLAVGLLKLTDAVEIAGLLSPDMASTAVLLGAWYLFLVRRQTMSTAALLALAVLFRFDYVLWVPMFVVAAIATKPGERPKRWWVVPAAGIATYATVFLVFHPPTLWTVIVHTFDALVYTPDVRPAFSIEMYLSTVVRHAGAFLHRTQLLFLGAAMVLVPLRWRHPSSAFWKWIILAAAFSVVARYFIFPILWPRFLIGYYLLMGIAFVGLLTQQRAGLGESDASDD